MLFSVGVPLMNRLMRFVLYHLGLLHPRIRFWIICRVVGVKPFPWVYHFACFAEPPYLSIPQGRQAGTTTAVFLRLLMLGWEKDGLFPVSDIVYADSDFHPDQRRCVYWYNQEYKKFCFKCSKAGLPYLSFDFMDLVDGHDLHKHLIIEVHNGGRRP